MHIDNAHIAFNAETQLLLKFILGFIIFGVALDIKLDDFKQVAQQPKAILIGLCLQFFVFPALTFLLIFLASQHPLTTFHPSIALGMLLLAACPGGNMSNFFTHLAKGNSALSVSMSAISTLAALIMTPLNFSFWGSCYPPTNALLVELALDPFDMLQTIIMILGIPLSLGMWLTHKEYDWLQQLKKPIKYSSIGLFVCLIVGALAANFGLFLSFIGTFALVVFIQNSLAISIGFLGARWMGLSHKDQKTVALEVGIQNSGLGLILFFQYFERLGGMGIIIAWWSVWHMISGLSLALYWQRSALIHQPNNQ